MIYEFGRFQVDPVQSVLLCDGVPMQLSPKAFDTLLILIEHGGAIVGKDELRTALWPDVYVDDNNLTQYISLLRRTLGDDRQSPRYIQTVAKRGYRFCCPVERRGLVEPVSVIGVAKGEASAPEVYAEAARERGSNWRRMLFPRAGLVLAAVVALTMVLPLLQRVRTAYAMRHIGSPVSVAVLPYEFSGRNGEGSFAGVALADDLIRQFSDQRAGVTVRPLSAIYRYSEGTVSPAAAAEELGATFAVVARVEEGPGGTVLRASLLNAKDGSAVWTQSFKGDAQDVFVLQDKLCESLAAALSIGGRSPRAHITRNLAAYGAFVRGRRQWNLRTSEGLYESVDSFDEAIAADPQFALAYAALADAYAFDLKNWRLADAMAQKALALDPKLGEAHASLGLVQMLWRRDSEAAANEFKTAIRLSPQYASAHQWYADNFATRARLLEAVEEMRKAADLDPDSVPINTELARILYLAHEFGPAREQAQRAVAMAPGCVEAHLLLHDVYIQMGDFDRAIAEFVRVEQLTGETGPNSAAQADRLAEAYAAGGIRGFWAARIDHLKSVREDDYLTAKYLALEGRNEDSLTALGRAMESRKQGKVLILFAFEEPAFDGLRQDERFQRMTDFARED